MSDLTFLKRLKKKIAIEIVAQRGNTYLVVEKMGDEKGYIIDLDQDMKSDKLLVDQILKWGYWIDPKNINSQVLSKIKLIYDSN